MNISLYGKNSIKNKPEILSPAGNSEAMRAAIQAGADAVYMGMSKFNARASANNFSFEELSEAVSYAHIYGTKLYIALNTLVNNAEFDQAVQMALEADRLGVDAFIIQDIGLLKKLKGKTTAKLHASTQMTVYSIDGLKELADMGVTRAVLARELSIKEIEKICLSGIMETEVFCHGALCISYSGQCMMSRFLTGRSGNRGTCSQPCRLNYRLNSPGVTDTDSNSSRGQNLFLPRLSPADLCSLPYLKELCEAGIDSLKIEGRLKSPEYAAIVTEKYRNALDNNFVYSEQDADDLTVIFSRGGFTSGHQLGKMSPSGITPNKPGHTGLPAGKLLMPPKKVNGPVSIYKATVNLDKNCIKQGDGITFEDKNSAGGIVNIITQNGSNTILTIAGEMPEYSKGLRFYKNYDAELMKKYSKYYAENASIRKVDITAEIDIFREKPCVLRLYDNIGNSVTEESGILCEYSDKEISKDAVAKKVSELGGTPFKAADIIVNTDKNSFIPFSVIKELRRNGVAKLYELRKERIL